MPAGSLLACTAAGAGQPHRRHPVQPGAAEDPAGSDHLERVRAVCDVLHEPAVQARLRVGRLVPGRGGVFHLPLLNPAPEAPAGFWPWHYTTPFAKDE